MAKTIPMDLADRVETEWDDRAGPVTKLQLRETTLGLCFCHRRSERCIEFFGIENYLCSRCLGVYLGAALGVIIVLVLAGPSPLLGLVLMAPLVVDGLTQTFLERESTNVLRLVTGLAFGIGAPQFVFSMTVGIP